MALDNLADNFDRQFNKHIDADYEQADLAALFAIPVYKRYPGMECWVLNDGTGKAKYILNADNGDDLSDNSLWEISNGDESSITTSKGIIYGGAEWSGTGLIFTVSEIKYNYYGFIGIVPPVNVTLDDGDGEDRFDIIAVDTISNTIIVVKGTPAINPIFPEVTESVITIQLVLVQAGATSPSITQTIVYRNNVEWTGSTAGSITGTVNFDSTDSPFVGSKVARIDSCNRNAIIIFTGTSIYYSDYSLLTFRIRVKSSIPSNIQFILRNRISGNNSGSAVNLKDLGFNPGLINSWQLIAIPTSMFGVVWGNSISFQMIHGNVALDMSWDLDNIVFSDGEAPAVPPVVDLSAYVKKDGSTPFTAPQEGIYPTNYNHLSTKQYVDGVIPDAVIAAIRDSATTFSNNYYYSATDADSGNPSDHYICFSEVGTDIDVSKISKIKFSGSTGEGTSVGAWAPRNYGGTVGSRDLTDTVEVGDIFVLNCPGTLSIRSAYKVTGFSISGSVYTADVDFLFSDGFTFDPTDYNTDDLRIGISIFPGRGAAITGYVKQDGTTPFTAIQKGLDSVEDDDLTTQGWVKGGLNLIQQGSDSLGSIGNWKSMASGIVNGVSVVVAVNTDTSYLKIGVSIDGGLTWQFIPNIISVGTSVVFGDGIFVYSGTSSGNIIAYSLDGGSTFVASSVTRAGTRSVSNVAYSDGVFLFMQSLSNNTDKIYSSSDVTSGWNLNNTTQFGSSEIYFIKGIIGEVGDRFFLAVSYDGKIWKSSDGGINWSNISTVPLTGLINLIAYYFNGTRTILAYKVGGETTATFRSIDDGVIWTNPSGNTDIPAAIDTIEDSVYGTVLVAAYHNISKYSLDNAESWVTSLPLNTPIEIMCSVDTLNGYKIATLGNFSTMISSQISLVESGFLPRAEFKNVLKSDGSVNLTAPQTGVPGTDPDHLATVSQLPPAGYTESEARKAIAALSPVFSSDYYYDTANADTQVPYEGQIIFNSAANGSGDLEMDSFTKMKFHAFGWYYNDGSWQQQSWSTAGTRDLTDFVQVGDYVILTHTQDIYGNGNIEISTGVYSIDSISYNSSRYTLDVTFVYGDGYIFPVLNPANNFRFGVSFLPGRGGTSNEEAIQGTAIYNNAMTGTVNLDLSTFIDIYGILTGNTTITVSGTPATGKSFVRSAIIKSTVTESLTLPAGWIVKGTYNADGTENDLEIKFTNYPTVGLKVWCYINGAT